jgi:hypothetical protein
MKRELLKPDPLDRPTRVRGRHAEPSKHGMYTHYTTGCRCVPCRNAFMAYTKEYRNRRPSYIECVSCGERKTIINYRLPVEPGEFVTLAGKPDKRRKWVYTDICEPCRKVVEDSDYWSAQITPEIEPRKNWREVLRKLLG